MKGAPQGSKIGPLLLNIQLYDLFNFLEDLDIASYADHTKIHTLKKTNYYIRSITTATFIWFYNNFMKTNSDKSHHFYIVVNHLQYLSMALPLNKIQKRYF